MVFTIFADDMNNKLMELADTYRLAGDAIHDNIREAVRLAGGFVNCSNNKRDKPDMNAIVFDGKKGYSQSFPIRAMRLNPKGEVEVYVGTEGTIYTERYLRNSSMAEEHWLPLKNSNILFYQTILSIAASLEEYL